MKAGLRIIFPYLSLAAALTSASVAQIPAINSVTVRPVISLPDPGPITAATAPSVPAGLASPSTGENFRLWIYDPRNPAVALSQTGIFLGSAAGGGASPFVSAAANGTLFMKLNPGTYWFDVVEPGSLSSSMTRLRYSATVASSGVVSVNDKTADDKGFFAVTVTLKNLVAQEKLAALTALANESALTFVPTSEFQLIDQVTPNRGLNVDLSAGFPRVRVRLPAYGRIRALIVPLDFAEIPGVDSPVPFFTTIADAVRDFYYAQSYGRLAFDFEILPKWLRLPFLATKYRMGAGVTSGDPNGYRAEIVALTDSLIDYSLYDAVYFLLPKEVPISVIGWGPAITYPIPTRKGYIVNGASGGADMYAAGNGPNAARNWMAHETGHAFGLYDEDLDHASQTLGSWSLMADSWSTQAIELNGWDRFLLGWLDQTQIAGLPLRTIGTAGTTVRLNPLARQNAETKVALIPLSTSKMLVLESRKSEGLDGAAGNKIPATQEGVLVYTVDMKLGQLKGGYKTQRRIGSTDANFRDAALRTGDRITVEGVEITVLELSSGGDTVRVRVLDAGAIPAPTIVSQPTSRAAEIGANAVLSVSVQSNLPVTYQWSKDGAAISGATNPALTLNRVGNITAGSYTVAVSNGLSFATSSAAVLSLVIPGHLINVSVLAPLAGAGDNLTLGYVVSGASATNPKPLVIRAAGPSLGALGVGGTMVDPQLELFAGATRTSGNDDWGGAPATSTAMLAVGAFSYTGPTSRDAAAVANTTSSDNSARVSASPNAPTDSGIVIAEIYDATPAASFDANTPRIINFSAMKNVSASVTLGFVLGGATSKTVLIRAVGPTLGIAPFNVVGAMADPKVELFDAASKSMGTNDNWGGTSALANAFAQSGAFLLPATSKDAALVATLAPGNYSVVVSPAVGTAGGTALLEVYTLP